MKNKNGLIALSLILILSSAEISACAQTGYQQPVEPDDSYDQILQGAQQAAPPPTTGKPLRGRVVVAPSGSRFQATLASPVSSGINQIGDVVTASVSSPLVIGNDVVIPAGSQIIGQVVNAVPAARFMAGSGGQ